MLWNRKWTVAQEKVHAVEKRLWEEVGKRLTALNVEIKIKKEDELISIK